MMFIWYIKFILFLDANPLSKRDELKSEVRLFAISLDNNYHVMNFYYNSYYKGKGFITKI